MQINDFKLERFFAKFEFNVKYSLSSSDCESVSIAELLKDFPETQRKFNELPLGYTESNGGKALRAEISKLYSRQSINDILCFSGAEEAIFTYLNCALTPKDHVIIHFPAYQALYEIPKAIGCEVTLWKAEYQSEWKLNISELEALTQKNTKAIIVNFPHNPTGNIMSKSDFSQLIHFADKHEIAVFSDEVYRFTELNEPTRLPSACDLSTNAVSLGVLSKSFGLPGLRIGWIATQDSTLLKKMAAFKDYTTICNSAPSEFLAAHALKISDKLLSRNLDIIRKNLVAFQSLARSHSNQIEFIAPLGGTMVFPKLKNGRNSNDLSKILFDNHQTLLLAGDLFDMDPSFFRIGLGRIDFIEALSGLDSTLKHF